MTRPVGDALGQPGGGAMGQPGGGFVHPVAIPGQHARSGNMDTPPHGFTMHRPPPPGRTVPASIYGAGEDLDSARRYNEEAEQRRRRAEEVERTSRSIRNQAIDRMIVFNRNHAQLAWRSRRSQPIQPYGLAFLYADPVPVDRPVPAARHSADEPSDQRRRTPAGYLRVVAATRVVQVPDDSLSLPTLLSRLIALAKNRYLPAGLFDPAAQMAIYRDAASGRAGYIGLGVSSLDTRSKTWAEVQTIAQSVDDVGGRCLLLLADDTAAELHRHPPRSGWNNVEVHCTGDLNYGHMTSRPWKEHPDVTTMSTPLELWDLIRELHLLIYQQNPRPSL